MLHPLLSPTGVGWSQWSKKAVWYQSPNEDPLSHAFQLTQPTSPFPAGSPSTSTCIFRTNNTQTTFNITTPPEDSDKNCGPKKPHVFHARLLKRPIQYWKGAAEVHSPQFKILIVPALCSNLLSVLYVSPNIAISWSPLRRTPCFIRYNRIVCQGYSFPLGLAPTEAVLRFWSTKLGRDLHASCRLHILDQDWLVNQAQNLSPGYLQGASWYLPSDGGRGGDARGSSLKGG